MRSKSQRSADARYEEKRRGVYTNVACRLKKVDANNFKMACREAGTTPNAVLLQAVQEFMKSRKSE